MAGSVAGSVAGSEAEEDPAEEDLAEEEGSVLVRGSVGGIACENTSKMQRLEMKMKVKNV